VWPLASRPSRSSRWWRLRALRARRPLRASLFACAALILALAVAGCGQRELDATPEGAVEAFLRAVDEAPRDATAGTRLVALLDAKAREALEVRANRARAIGGRQVEPAAMLSPMWSPVRFEVDRLTAKIDGDGEHGIVDVYGVDPSTQHARVPVVREGERWRVVVLVPPQP
jgi:hypothetical protein